uniref:60S ribosomal protein L35a n=1 Tax=Euplotes harpa TaxID=151035 RepID=A0A7S3JCV2_9SPIT|mmetsp:Transcript_32979/g.37821  ORF Transcript_32979/g.37821 Transcript_32979/m.37821 type:complete len:116 (+) Transcript_32979:31-378(+)
MVKDSMLRRRGGGEPIRLYQPGVFSGFRRSRVNQFPNHALIHIEGVKDVLASRFYLGKKVVLVRKAPTGGKSNKRFRTMWGKVISSHGKNGVVRAKFRHNLPAEAIGERVRVMLY